MFCKNIKLDGVKKTFLTIFSVAVLAFGFGALNVPEAEAAVLTVTSTTTFLSMCKTNSISFTVKEDGSLITGAIVTLSGGSTGTCTTVAGLCSITPTIIKGDVVATAKKTGSTDGVLNFKTSDNSIRKGASKEFVSETENFCYNACNDDISASDITEDCADSDCSGKTCYVGSQKGTCNLNEKACKIPTETFSTISAGPTSISVGVSTTITFTADANDVQVTLTGVGVSTSCQTGSGGSKKCSVDVNPTSSGSITVTAQKGATTKVITISVNAADAIKITIDPSVKSITLGKSVTVNFTVMDKSYNLLNNAKISITGAGITKENTTDSSGKWLDVVLFPTTEGTIIITASATPLIPGSISIPVLPAGTTGGTGAGGLTTASLSEIIGRMIDWLLSVAAGLAVLFMIIGGVYYVTAAGNDAQIETAKKMIAYSIIGLVFVIVSYSIVVTINSIITG